MCGIHYVSPRFRILQTILMTGRPWPKPEPWPKLPYQLLLSDKLCLSRVYARLRTCARKIQGLPWTAISLVSPPVPGPRSTSCSGLPPLGRCNYFIAPPSRKREPPPRRYRRGDGPPSLTSLWPFSVRPRRPHLGLLPPPPRSVERHHAEFFELLRILVEGYAADRAEVAHPAVEFSELRVAGGGG